MEQEKSPTQEEITNLIGFMKADDPRSKVTEGQAAEAITAINDLPDLALKMIESYKDDDGRAAATTGQDILNLIMEKGKYNYPYVIYMASHALIHPEYIRNTLDGIGGYVAMIHTSEKCGEDANVNDCDQEHFTGLALTDDDIKEAKSSDPDECNCHKCCFARAAISATKKMRGKRIESVLKNAPADESRN